MPGPDEVNAIRQGPRPSRKALELDPGQEPLCKTFARGPCAGPSPRALVQDPNQGPMCRTHACKPGAHVQDPCLQARGPCAGPMLASQGPMCKLLLLRMLLLLLPSRNKGLCQFFDPTMNHDISIPMMNHDIPISMMTKRPSLGDVALLHDRPEVREDTAGVRDGAAAAAAAALAAARSFWII